MLKVSVSKDMKFMLHKKGGGSIESSNKFMSNTFIVKESKFSVKHSRVVRNNMK